MNLSTMLRQRAAAGRPVRIGLIGAGKFGSMVLAQAQRIPGSTSWASPISMSARRAPRSARVGWPAERYSATSLGDAVKTGKTCVLDDVERAHRLRRNRMHHRGDRSSDRRRPACARGHRRRQAPHHGQCRGRRALSVRFWRRGPGPRTSSTAWLMATSRP